MAKRKKQAKRKTGARKKRAPISKPVKRRGRNVYDIRFTARESLNDLEEKISTMETPYKIPSNELVKITVLSKVPGEKRENAVTYIYDQNTDPFEINIDILDVVYEIYYPQDKRKQKDYLKRVARGKVSRVIVDFDTTGNYKLTG